LAGFSLNKLLMKAEYLSLANQIKVD
jgi:hypothetical protein